MEEIKNRIISEEALDEIAGGLRLPKITVKKVLTGAGILIGALAALGGATGLGYGAYKLATGKKEEGEAPAAVPPATVPPETVPPETVPITETSSNGNASITQ